jgi:hypothetical protein
MKLVTIIGIFRTTILQNRGFAGDYPLKKPSTKSQNAQLRLVTSSGERYKVLTHDHIFFSPNTDEQGDPLPEEERAQNFIISGTGSRYRILFFDAITGIDVGSASSNR